MDDNWVQGYADDLPTKPATKGLRKVYQAYLDSQKPGRKALVRMAQPGGWFRFYCRIPADVYAEYQAQPKGADVIRFLRERMGDDRFTGHAMVWHWVDGDDGR